MNELIKIAKNGEKSVVNARELHEVLESKQKFSDWIKNRIDQYDFEEGVDYEIIEYDYQGNALHKNMKSNNQQVSKRDYAITVDVAKEIAMVEGNEKGKQVRKYFIACEKQLANNKPSLPSTYAEALRQLATEVEEKEKISLQLEAKTEQLDESKEWITIKRFAKENGLNWRNISWRVLKALSVEHGYEVKKVFDANYGEVNIYHKNVFAIWNKSKAKYLK